MAKNRLENLTLTSVDFCPKGMNPDADITLFKADAKNSDKEDIGGFVAALKRMLAYFSGEKEAEDKKAEAEKAYPSEDMEKVDAQKMQKNQDEGKEDVIMEHENTVVTPQVDTEMQKAEETLAKAMETLQAELKKAQDEVEELKKANEMQAMTVVAQKYEVPLGKKADELAVTLYDMKKASPEIYDNYIAVLDEQVNLVNKSGLFTEVGKSSHGTAVSVEERAQAIASEMQKADPNLTHEQALAKAWMSDPVLIAEYEGR